MFGHVVLGAVLIVCGAAFFVRGDPAKRGVTKTRSGGPVASKTLWYTAASVMIAAGLLQLILAVAGR